jgi:hypothetical protein
VRVGRQALTWGSGLVFRPMDLFNPFSPTATDTEYKPGADMVYVQQVFADGSDLQLIVVPRPPRRGAGPSSDAEFRAAHLQTTIAGHPTTWLLAHDHGDWVAAARRQRRPGRRHLEPGGGSDLPGPRAARASRRLANISYSATLAQRNATLFAEYFT